MKITLYDFFGSPAATVDAPGSFIPEEFDGAHPDRVIAWNDRVFVVSRDMKFGVLPPPVGVEVVVFKVPAKDS